MTADDFKRELAKHCSKEAAAFAGRFFKTGEDQYGAGDEFIGAKVPDIRAVCKKFKDLPLAEVQKLLDSPIHEHRLGGVILLANKYPKAAPPEQQEIFDL